MKTIKYTLMAVCFLSLLTACANLPEKSNENNVSNKIEIWKTMGTYQVKEGMAKNIKSNLFWTRCSYGMQWKNDTCIGEAKSLKYYDAKNAADKFRAYGYSDWRLPTTKELRDMVYCSSGSPKVWNVVYEECKGNYSTPTIYQNVFPKSQKETFWTSSLFRTNTEGQYYDVVNFNNGAIESHHTNNKSLMFFVR